MKNTEQEIEEQRKYINKVKDINAGKELMYYILTMGCKLNENDSEKLCGMLEKMGYSKTEDMKSANLILINTCCVRENAEDKLFGKLGEVKKIKEKNNCIIAVGGCMMQEEHIVEKINKSYKFYDVIFGTHTLHRFPEDLYKALLDNKRVQDVIDIDGEIYENIPIKRDDKTVASVAIMNGCNNFCTYCIVPYVRGRERSRKPEDILKEINQLAKDGYKEITLLGQNVNSYNGGENYKFADLLKDCEKIEGIEKIKFISPHPKDFSDDVIDVIANSKKISKMIHLPLQYGSTNILKLMNRKYTKEQYLELVEKMMKKIENVSISTDIILGFPGESEEDFEDTLDVVRKVGYDQVFMFIYSRRVGTPADKMENQIAEEIKHKRFNRLKELVENQMQENNEKYVGKEIEILIEGTSKTNEEMLTGRTDSNKVVVLKADKNVIGKIKKVRITKNCLWYLQAELVN